MARIRVSPARLAQGVAPVVVYSAAGRDYVTGVEIQGPCRVVWDPSSDPPSVWIETESPLSIQEQ